MLYTELFKSLNDYYAEAIELDPKNYTKRKYHKNLDELLAVHLSLAFIYLKLEVDSFLLNKFWSNNNILQHQEFIKFIGRDCLSRKNAEEWLSNNNIDKNRLIKFWDWALVDISEPKALSGFGFWINYEEEVLEDEEVLIRMAKTLKKSVGDISWDYGMIKRLPIWAAKSNKESVLEIIENYLLDSKSELNKNRLNPVFAIDNEIKEALELVYRNGNKDIKEKVTNLISTLVEKGSYTYWNLKEILKG